MTMEDLALFHKLYLDFVAHEAQGLIKIVKFLTIKNCCKSNKLTLSTFAVCCVGS